ncbi:TPA: uroporphyrinogen-III C-methyltransferase [Neisseria weaveri]
MSKPENTLSENGQDTTPSTSIITVSSDGTAHTAAEPEKTAEQPVRTQPENKPADKPQQGSHRSTPAIEKTMTEKHNVPTNAPVVIKQSSGKGLAAGALVLAILGLGASGFLFVQGQNTLKTQELAFNQRLDKAALGESQNASLLQDTLRKNAEIESTLSQLSTASKLQADQISATRKAYGELLKSRTNWAVDEAEVMLNLASQQLLLSGNVSAAVIALENIENRLSRFDQPELLPIKQAISNDLTGLKNRPYLDISGTSLRLDRLETAVAGLPLVVDATLNPGKQAVQENAAAANLPWWEAAWNKALSSLKGMVELRRLDNNDAMLIAPEQIYFIRENLRLRLLDARTALMQHNGEVYQSDLNSVEASVKQYFDLRSPATQSWLKELAELKTLNVHMISDDALKASQTAVRTYQDAVRTSQTAPAAIAPDAASSEAASAAVPANTPASEPVPAATTAAPAQTDKPAEPADNKPASEPAVKGETA